VPQPRAPIGNAWQRRTSEDCDARATEQPSARVEKGLGKLDVDVVPMFACECAHVLQSVASRQEGRLFQFPSSDAKAKSRGGRDEAAVAADTESRVR